MTNEEILFQYVPGEDLYSQIELMLDAARKDEAVAFAEWIKNSEYQSVFISVFIENEWKNEETREHKTTSELYTIFKQKNRQQ